MHSTIKDFGQNSSNNYNIIIIVNIKCIHLYKKKVNKFELIINTDDLD